MTVHVVVYGEDGEASMQRARMLVTRCETRFEEVSSLAEFDVLLEQVEKGDWVMVILAGEKVDPKWLRIWRAIRENPNESFDVEVDGVRVPRMWKFRGKTHWTTDRTGAPAPTYAVGRLNSRIISKFSRARNA